jgi:5-methylcytosine-specific restriction protein A
MQPIEPGEILKNEDLIKIFKVSPQGGMRRSLKTNSLVIVSNHVKSIYDDRWVGDTFEYTGMGATGNHSLSFAQNRTLAESNENGIDVYLFEVFVNKEYVFIGKVKLSGKPFTEIQPDVNNVDRNVVVFPLELSSGKRPKLPQDYIKKPYYRKLRKASLLSDDELRKRAGRSRRKPGIRNTSALQHERDPYIVEYAKRRAKGHCELCNSLAPFKNKKGFPYLETHHIKWLAKGGEDTIENTVALCPNCHRKVHILELSSDISKLQNINKYI